MQPCTDGRVVSSNTPVRRMCAFRCGICVRRAYGWHMGNSWNTEGADAVEVATRACMIDADLAIPESGNPAMARTPRERTRQRCVMTTDSEWEMIGALARRAGRHVELPLPRRARARIPGPRSGGRCAFRASAGGPAAHGAGHACPRPGRGEADRGCRRDRRLGCHRRRGERMA